MESRKVDVLKEEPEQATHESTLNMLKEAASCRRLDEIFVAIIFSAFVFSVTLMSGLRYDM